MLANSSFFQNFMEGKLSHLRLCRKSDGDSWHLKKSGCLVVLKNMCSKSRACYAEAEEKRHQGAFGVRFAVKKMFYFDEALLRGKAGG